MSSMAARLTMRSRFKVAGSSATIWGVLISCSRITAISRSYRAESWRWLSRVSWRAISSEMSRTLVTTMQILSSRS